MKDLLEILNSKPLGMFPCKAEKMAWIKVCEYHDVLEVRKLPESIEYYYNEMRQIKDKIWQAYTKNFVGERTELEQGKFGDQFYIPDEDKIIYEEVKLLPAQIWAGEEPIVSNYVSYAQHDLTESTTSNKYYNDLEQFNQRKEQVLFDGITTASFDSHKGTGTITVRDNVNMPLMRRNGNWELLESISIHDFHVAGTPFNLNALNLIIK